MSYAVTEIFHTLQGEGARTGRAAVFCRFTGCNLWSGREKDRAAAVCRFCDTDFVGTHGPGGGLFADAESLAGVLRACWDGAVRKGDGAVPYLVCTGGEPLLQLDQPLADAARRIGFEVAVETNGTVAAPPGLDWICVSPKAGAHLVQTSGSELKVVWPQETLDLDFLSGLDFRHFFLQPMDGVARAANTAQCAEYCRTNPRWRLSLQTHKLIGIK